MRNLVYVILDSCRFDSLQRAATPNFDRIGQTQCKYSYASWTLPSHFVYLMGMIPHDDPKRVFASEVYKSEFSKWVDRLDIQGLEFKTFVPHLSLPRVLQENGYETVARVSLPVLNSHSGLNRFFDDYDLMDDHNDFEGMIDEVEFSDTQPSFYFLNLGETHYPYMLEPSDMPHISGVHGVFKRLDDHLGEEVEEGAPEFFTEEQLSGFHDQQVRCVEHVDDLFESLLSKAPSGTHFIVTADHGECFGEAGQFGHGPIIHEKVFQVPFIEGVKN